MKCNRCGKENPAEIHTCTPPLALRLADEVDEVAQTFPDMKEVSDELRRLHAENGALREALAVQPKQEPVMRWCETCSGTGQVYQEHQAGCWVGGKHDCPDCEGHGYTVPKPQPKQEPVSIKAVAAKHGINMPNQYIPTMDDAIAAGDGVLMNEQAALLRECRAALDSLIQKKPALAGLLCGSTTLGNLRALLYDYRPQGVFSGTAPQPHPQKRPQNCGTGLCSCIECPYPDHFPDAGKMIEPFGYFRSTLGGWEDCAETDEGARPLYEAPQHEQDNDLLTIAYMAGFHAGKKTAPQPDRFADAGKPMEREWVGLTPSDVHELVDEADLDWHNGWSLDEEVGNRYLNLCRAIEAKLREKNT